LYVAVRRAKERLIISAHTKINNAGRLGLDGGWNKLVKQRVWMKSHRQASAVMVNQPPSTCDLAVLLVGNLPHVIEPTQPDHVWRVVMA
jgi:hypothetical protein